jgi:hypothetical protein
MVGKASGLSFHSAHPRTSDCVHAPSTLFAKLSEVTSESVVRIEMSESVWYLIVRYVLEM